MAHVYEEYEGEDLDDWRYTVTPSKRPDRGFFGAYVGKHTDRYDVLTLDEIKPQHQVAVALLLAAVYDLPFNGIGERSAVIEGIGAVDDDLNTGPWFYLDNF